MKTKKLLSLILTLAMVLSLLPLTAAAASANWDDVPCRYFDEQSGTFKTRMYVAEIITSSAATWNESNGYFGYYVARGKVTINSPVTVNGNVSLILEDDCTLTVNGGISVSDGSLSIYAQSDGANRGKLLAYGKNVSEMAKFDSLSGIGSKLYSPITIHGGDITAIGGNGIEFGGEIFGGSPGIGSAGTVVIYGGKITAVGGSHSAGIGSGYGDISVGSVIINGGDIEATGGFNGSGIGGGAMGAGGGTITINGGNIIATAGGSNEAAVGNGFMLAANANNIMNSSIDIYINGGMIYAESRVNAVGNSRYMTGTTIHVGDESILLDMISSNAFVKLPSRTWNETLEGYSRLALKVTNTTEQLTYLSYTDGDPELMSCDTYMVVNRLDYFEMADGWYAALGNMDEVGNLVVSGDAHLVLTDNCKLTATGGLTIRDGGSLTIYAQSETDSMGRLTVNAKDRPGISGGNVTVYGGDLRITGDTGYAGIGSGTETLTLYGGKLTAAGGESAEGIDCRIEVADRCRVKNAADGEPITKEAGQEWSDVLGGSSVSIVMDYQKLPLSYLKYVDGSYTEGSCEAYKIGGNGTYPGGWYVLNGDIRGSITVDGDVNLILLDGTAVSVENGITVPIESSLTIYAQSDGENTGKLIASASVPGYAGIGENNVKSSGSIIIHGGSVTAISQTSCGLGGGHMDADITVCGGSVTASGAPYGIGSTNSYRRGTLTLADGLTLIDNATGEPVVKKPEQTWIDVFKAPDVSFTAVPKKTSYRMYDAESGTFTEKECEEFTFVHESSTWSGGWYVCEGTLTTDEPVNISGNVDLIIADGKTFTAKAGICVPEGSSLTVYGQTEGTGKLIANGSENCAGIGGGNGENGGSLIIHGGNIIAKGGYNAAGIGGGNGGNGGYITLYSGDITASAGENAGRAVGAGVGGSGNGSIEAPTVPELCVLYGFDYFLKKDRNEQWINVLSADTVNFHTVSKDKYKNVGYLYFDMSRAAFDSKTADCRILENTEDNISGYWVVDKDLEFTQPLNVKGNAELILMDNCTLTAAKGIIVNKGSSLAVYAQSDGENMGGIIATGYITPGIGSVSKTNYGSITICGGNIRATGHALSAGIGGGREAAGGNITICGGTVTAVGSAYAAGIGDGYNGSGSNIVIYGGNITASTTGEAAAIGSSTSDSCTVTVADNIRELIDNTTGQPVIKEHGQEWKDAFSVLDVSFTAVTYDTLSYLAYNTEEKTFEELKINQRKYNNLYSNITSWEDGKWYVANGNVEIENVTVTGDANLILKDGCELTVSEGIAVGNNSSLTVYAQSDGENAGALIAEGAYGGAGIGGAGKVIIHGGNIKATGSDGSYGNDGGAGIGGGGDVTVYGGTIEARGADGGAGIGGGYYDVVCDYDFDYHELIGLYDWGTAGKIAIYGGTITAVGGYNAAGIGGGCGCDGGDVRIYGGYVNAEGGATSGITTTEYVGGIGCGWFDILEEDYWEDIVYSDAVGGGTFETDGDVMVKAAENADYIPLPTGKSVNDYRYAYIFDASSCLGITSTHWEDVEKKHDAATSFYVEGVQIRLFPLNEGDATQQGMRFIATLGKDVLANFAALNVSNIAPGNENTSVGFLVAPTASVGSSGLTMNSVKKTVVPAANIFDENTAVLQYTVCILGIDAAHWKNDVTARPYITYQDENGDEHTVYGDAYSTCVYDAVEYGIKYDKKNADALTALMDAYKAEIAAE